MFKKTNFIRTIPLSTYYSINTLLPNVLYILLNYFAYYLTINSMTLDTLCFYSCISRAKNSTEHIKK